LPFQSKKKTKTIKATVMLPCFVDLEVSLDPDGEAIVHSIRVKGEHRFRDVIDHNDKETLDDIDEKARQAFGYYDDE